MHGQELPQTPAETGPGTLPELVPPGVVGLLGRSLRRHPELRGLLPSARNLRPGLPGPRPDSIAVWAGSRWLAHGRRLAQRRALPFRVIGDGLLRGPETAGMAHPILSLAVTEGGGAEALLANPGWETPELAARAQAVIAALVAARLGGDCFAADPGATALGLPSDGAALIVAPGSDADPAGVARMLAAAEAEAPADKIVVLAAPGRDGSRPMGGIAAARGWRLLDRRVSPWSLIDGAASVYTLGDEIGLLALLAGRRVRCFGRPLYAGWGATLDDPSVAPRGPGRSTAEIFAALCLLGSRYLDPFSGATCSFEESCGALGEWHRRNAVNRTIAACTGMSFWKRRRVAQFLRSTAGTPAFRRRPEAALAVAAARHGALAVWGAREPPGLATAAAAAGVPLLRVEDGFVRSVGLGADFMPAASLVVDGRGIYYDPTGPSDLEAILAETPFDAALVERARRLIRLLVQRGITKYNTGGALPALGAAPDRRILFVPGQVEDDCSVLRGGQGVAGNLDLLARVRARNPDAFILYKPHPDVDAGHRRGAVPDAAARHFADRVLRDVSSAAIIAAVDEVHTLTSLAGFEALLRRRRVVVHGRPFYAGWGLTHDLDPPPQRRRQLTLEELVAGTLILYPRYLDPVTRLPCGPEVVIDRLADPALWRPGLLVRLRRMQGAATRHWRPRAASRAAASAAPVTEGR